MDRAPQSIPDSSHKGIAVGDILSPLQIIDLTVEGGAIARHDGQVVFLDSGVQEAVVKARVTSRRKKIINATVMEILEPSPHEAIPWCPYFEQCGGCMWQHVSLSAQYAWKEKRIGDTLARLGGVSVPVAPLVTGEVRGFRTRMTYAFGESEGRAVIGLRQKNSQQVVPLDSCGLQRASARILPAIQLFLDKNPEIPVWQNKEGYWRFMTVHTPLAVLPEMPNGQVVVEIIVNKGPEATHLKVYDFLKGLLDQGIISGGIVSQRTTRSTLAFGEKTLFETGRTELFESYSGAQPYTFSPKAFMQTNTGIFSKLLERVFALVPPSVYGNIWDLYSGCGVIGQYLIERNGSRDSSRLFGVDNDSNAIRYAEKNAQNRNITKAVYAAGRMDDIVSQATFSPDLIIMDPPRSGVDESVLNIVNQSGASYIIYISCDVATQARDLKRLGDGWLCQGAYPFDMFPGTPHIENIVLLTRKSKGE